MPLFQRDTQNLTLIKPKNFSNENELQFLVEGNLAEVFSCRLVASKYRYSDGEIDTLALSEDNNPVIIEYKVRATSDLVNQSLYYLSWLQNHQGNFEMAVQKEFPNGKVGDIDWSSIRVICIAPEYKKYDLHAVETMGVRIELWKYRYYQNDTLFFEEVHKKAGSLSAATGKKAALASKSNVYTVEQHLNKIDKNKRVIVKALRDYILGIDESVEEVPKKHYIAYRVSKNFACMEILKNKIHVFLKIEPRSINEPPNNFRDVSNIGHYGTGNSEITVTNEHEVEIAQEYILMAFNNIGGN